MKQFIIQYMIEHGLKIDFMTLGGIRNEANSDLDYFNDWLWFIYNNDFFIAKGTTDPGIYYTDHPMNKNGAFHLDLGYHKEIWRLRLHNNKYLALCDDWKTQKVKGWRDKNKNFIDDDNLDTSGNFGINWHYSTSKELINYASAGCQVTNNKKFFDKSIKCAKESKQGLFSYLLLDIKEIPLNLKIDLGQC